MLAAAAGVQHAAGVLKSQKLAKGPAVSAGLKAAHGANAIKTIHTTGCKRQHMDSYHCNGQKQQAWMAECLGA